MSERRPGPRRRDERRSRPADQHAPLSALRPLGPPLEVLSVDQVERILGTAYRILEELGMEIRSAAARARYRSAGALIDDDSGIVRLGRDLVEAQLAHAPASFTLRARNPDRALQVGGNAVNFGPVHGAPNIRDGLHGRRYGTIDAFRNILKLTQALGVTQWQGGIVVEPTDCPVATRHLDAYLAHIECSDLVWAARGVGRVQAEDALQLSALEHACSLDDLVRHPTLMTVTNVNSPRRVDEEILDNIMVMAEFGQCVVVTPFTLMGAMAPVTLAGALAQQTAEALAIVTLCQLIRPGAPCVLGGFTSNVDLKSGSPAFGTPEYVQGVIASAQIGRRLRLPVRTSAVNASPCVDAQATYETAFALQAAILSHSHLVSHATGWLEGGLSASYEKIVIDAELIRHWAGILRPVEFTDEDLGFDTIREVPPGGHHFGTAHTLARYQTAFYRPMLSDWSSYEAWVEKGSKDATTRATALWQQLLSDSLPPPLDAAVHDSVLDYVARRRKALQS